MKKIVLVVEADDERALTLEGWLFSYDATIVILWARNALEAEAAVQRRRPDLFLFNEDLPEVSGTFLYRQFGLKKRLADIPAIIFRWEDNKGTSRAATREALPTLDQKTFIELANHLITTKRNIRNLPPEDWLDLYFPQLSKPSSMPRSQKYT